MLCRKHLDCDFVSLFDGFSEPNVFCGAFRLKLGCHLVCLEGEGEILTKPVYAELCGP